MAKFQIDVRELPSRGLFYNVEYIEMESLEVDDVFDISTSSEKFLEDILDSMIIERQIVKNFNFNNILLIDKEYIYLKLKEATFTSSILELDFTCGEEKCTYHNEDFEIDIFEHVVVTQIPEDYELPTFKYGKDKKFEKKLRFPTIGDTKKAKALKNEEIFKSYYNPLRAFLATFLTGDLYGNFETVSGKSFEGDNFVPKDVYKFQKFINESYTFGIENYIDVTCPKCEETRRLPFQVDIETFVR